MKKASAAARRHTLTTNKRNGNGNNGHGHADGEGAPATKSTRGNGNGGERRLDQLDGQPSIAEILGAARRESLDKAKLLSTLAAFKKGDFSVRMPGELEGL